MKICVLASGSAGNALVVESLGTSVLIDAGLSYQNLCRRMKSRGIDPDSIQAVFLTHGHGDHVCGARRWLEKHGTPVYGTLPTLRAADISDMPGAVRSDIHESTRVSGLSVNAMPVAAHNADLPVTFWVRDTDGTDGTKFVVISETGRLTEEMWRHIPDATALLVEANHDKNMLANGPYPMSLAQRVRANHLSNDDAAHVLRKLTGKTKLVILAHLSETNNDPKLVLEVAQEALAGRPDVRLVVADQHEATEVLTI